MSVSACTRRLITCVLPLSILLACVRQPSILQPTIPLLPVNDLLGNWQVTESLQYQDMANPAITYMALAVWSKVDEQFQLVLFNGSGQTLSTLSYDGENITQKDSALMGEMMLPGRDIIAQLQLYHWPLQKAQAYLAATPWQLIIEGNNKKTLLFHDKPYISFIQNDNSVIVQYVFTDNKLMVTTLQKEKI